MRRVETARRRIDDREHGRDQRLQEDVERDAARPPSARAPTSSRGRAARVQKTTIPARHAHATGLDGGRREARERRRRDEEDRPRAVEEEPRDDRARAVAREDRPREHEIERVGERVGEDQEVAPQVTAREVEAGDVEEDEHAGRREERRPRPPRRASCLSRPRSTATASVKTGIVAVRIDRVDRGRHREARG